MMVPERELVCEMVIVTATIPTRGESENFPECTNPRLYQARVYLLPL